jgi:hypothetical protein
MRVAPYVRISTAVDLRFSDKSRVTSAASYLGWHQERLAEAETVKAWACDLPVPARINHGRWLTDCPNCHGGALTHPEWKLACCGECGCIMRRVEFPEMVAAIETVLLARATRDVQNWVPPETVADLLRENAEHGV